MGTLANDDATARLVVVHAIVKCFVPPVVDALSFRFTIYFSRIVGIVHYQNIALLASDGTTNGGRGAKSSPRVLVPTLYVLIAGQLEYVAPPLPIPFRLNQSTTRHRVADYQVAFVRGAQPTHSRLIDPRPGWPEDAHSQRLRRTRGDVNDEVEDVATADGFEVLAHGVDMSAMHEFRGWLDYMPGLFDKIIEVIRRF